LHPYKLGPKVPQYKVQVSSHSAFYISHLICPAEKPMAILKPLPFCLTFKVDSIAKFSFYPTNPKGLIRKIAVPVNVFPFLARKEGAREKIQKY